MGMVAILAIAGCSSSSTSTPAPPTPVTSTVIDPTGDTNTGGSGTIYDITGFTISRTGPPGGHYTTITVKATFVQPVLLPAAGALPDATQLAFILAFDTDNNTATGTNYNLCSTGGGGTYNGADFIVDGNGATGNRLADGNYQITAQPASTATGEATVIASGNTMTWTVPISALSGVPAGPFNFGLIVGNGPAPSDCAPNSGFQPASDALAPLSGTPSSRTFTTWSH